ALLLRRQAEELASDIHELSHELHSSKLKHLGLRVALKELCRKFGEQNKLQIDAETDLIPENVPPDVALCLFRVAQEALNNACRHGHASHIVLRAKLRNGSLALLIRDNGSGFDGSNSRWGLGLTSMRERLRYVGGDLQVESEPEKGTEIRAA